MSSVYEQLREQVATNRLQMEKMRGAHLERSRRLLESQYDWVGPYADMIEKYRREPFLAGPTTRRDRQGRNYPIYQTEMELALLRAPSRVLCAANTYAIGLIEGITSYVLGSGLTYRASAKHETVPPELVAACQAEIDEFLAREQWYGGEQPSMEEELLWRECEDGESILAHYCDDDGLTTCRTVEPEQLTSPNTGDPCWNFGIYTESKDVQRHLKYWVQWGETPADGQEMGPDDIVHVRRNVKRSSKRGVPDFCFDMLDALQLGGRLRINMSDAAAQQAAIVGVRQHQGASKAEVEEFIKGEEDFESAGPGVTIATGKRETNNYLRRGHWEDIDNGQMYVGGPLATNGMVHIEILQACLRGAAVRWNAPEWLVSGLHDTSSFASSLTAESPFTRRIIRCQRTVREARRRTMLTVVRNRCKYRKLVALGRTWTWQEVSGLVDILAEAPSPEVRDALAEAQTAAIEIPLGVDSRQRYVQAHGRDWDQVEQDNSEYAEANGPPVDLDAVDPTNPDVGTTKPVVESRQLVESFRESEHPRDDQGRFVSKSEIDEAKSDPAKAQELRDRVTDPEQRAKLDKAIGQSGVKIESTTEVHRSDWYDERSNTKSQWIHEVETGVNSRGERGYRHTTRDGDTGEVLFQDDWHKNRLKAVAEARSLHKSVHQPAKKLSRTEMDKLTTGEGYDKAKPIDKSVFSSMGGKTDEIRIEQGELNHFGEKSTVYRWASKHDGTGDWTRHPEKAQREAEKKVRDQPLWSFEEARKVHVGSGAVADPHKYLTPDGPPLSSKFDIEDGKGSVHVHPMKIERDGWKTETLWLPKVHDPSGNEVRTGVARSDMQRAINEAEALAKSLAGRKSLLESLEVLESFNESDHPRDDHGRFVSKEEISDAKGDPKKKAELRDRVTDPGERKKLDAALGDKPAEEKAPPKPKTKKAREDLAKSKQQEWLQGMAEAGVKPGTPRSPEAKALETSLLQGLGQLKSGQEMIGPGKYRELTDAEYAGVLRTVNSAIAQLKDKSTWK